MTCTRHLCPRWLHVAPAAALLALTGCASRYDDLKVFVQRHEQDVAASEYVIEPPDALVIASPTCPELEGQAQVVGPDGKITLPLLGEVKVTDLTPREVAARLKELLSVYYTDPDVTVRVVGHESKKIFVFGEVSSIGTLPFTGRDSVLDVLAMCRMTRYAWGAQVKIIRPGPSEQERHDIVVDVDHMMETGDTRGNVLLQEGDIVYVPLTPLAWVGMRIQDLLFPFQSAAQAYSMPAAFMGANDYYQDRGATKTTVHLSPTNIGAQLP
jgi:polysaccharide biosynthesis/export protein